MGNPKSEIQNAKSEIQFQNQKSKIRNPKSEIQNKKSKTQNPNGPFGFWILDLGGPRRSHVANKDVWPSLQINCFGLASRLPSSQPKGAMARFPHVHSKLGTIILLKTKLRFPVPCHGNRGLISRETVLKSGVAKRPF